MEISKNDGRGTVADGQRTADSTIDGKLSGRGGRIGRKGKKIPIKDRYDREAPNAFSP